MPPLAVAAVKDRVARGLSDRQGQAIRDDEWTLQDLLTTEDGQEGLRAFLEGRPPVWRGR
jgi:enoyl-CoA hydratase/carnithine racemase